MKRNNENQFKIRLGFGVIILFFVVVAIGCSSSSTPIAQKKICPTSISETPEAKGNTPKLIVILIKEHPDYRNFSLQAFDILTSTLPKVLEPGDRVVLMSMEQSKLNAAIFFDGEVEFVEKPAISNSPTPPPPIGTLPSPTAQPQGGFMASVATQDAIKFMEGTKVAATESAFEYECAMETWKQGNQELWQKWNSERQAAIQAFMNEFSSAIEVNKVEGFQVKRSQIFEAVELGALVLNTECSKYVRCDLVVFSDFYDYRNGDYSQANIALPKIEVAGILLDCGYLAQCQENITHWENYFEIFGASSSEFAHNREAEKVLLSYLRR